MDLAPAQPLVSPTTLKPLHERQLLAMELLRASLTSGRL